MACVLLSQQFGKALMWAGIVVFHRRYKEFLDSVTPKEWFAAQAARQEVNTRILLGFLSLKLWKCSLPRTHSSVCSQ
jgi:hypothetical protein